MKEYSAKEGHGEKEEDEVRLLSFPAHDQTLKRILFYGRNMSRITQVDFHHCGGCGECVRVFPKDAVSVYKGCYAVIDSSVCLKCGMCERVCPAGAVKVVTVKEA